MMNSQDAFPCQKPNRTKLNPTSLSAKRHKYWETEKKAGKPFPDFPTFSLRYVISGA